MILISKTDNWDAVCKSDLCGLRFMCTQDLTPQLCVKNAKEPRKDLVQIHVNENQGFFFLNFYSLLNGIINKI